MQWDKNRLFSNKPESNAHDAAPDSASRIPSASRIVHPAAASPLERGWWILACLVIHADWKASSTLDFS